ncbi:sugar ABC transporter permease [Actinosynnema pretiosum subsp. pretiosum]|uniref:Binding-protein-dependent transport systems inner membrane component n=2 Tax=Actinosynnema TaxID=40566 RepID=C6WGQ3_ACTMD|nr:sugar ABC transporter permease [Actinosynnema mirum]ACU34369.1 binding-protein-dependent transport systems inner membrane component [Actinosynnema mirum DSM 43827]AXX27741.1 sugar transporter integral membrane protein [Actinosynnema pretiosum subsp. pretiosum]QUF01560.1 sugar ABC transporter permease [Actinosynnema pretiosum subsp. pretiosum]
MTAVDTTGAGASTGNVPPAPPRSAKGGGGRRRGSAFDRALPYLLLAPALVAILWLIGFPVLSVLLTSFRRLNLRELTRGQVVWTGLDNYTEVLGDPDFWLVTGRTVAFTAAVVGASVLAGLLLAVLMRQVSPLVRIVLQVAMLLAWAMPLLAATTVYQWIFDQEYGILNKTLVQLGFDSYAGYSWFSTGLSTLGVVGLMITWQAVPFLAFSLYAGLIGIPRDQYEAAGIDGASPWQTFRAVTWPELRPLLMMVTFLSVLWDFKVFAQIWAFRQGGPDGASTTLAVYQYLVGISQSHFGVAAAVSVVMMLLLAAVTFQYLRRLVRSQEGEL